MGYEIIFNFFEKRDGEQDFNRDEPPKSKSIKVGSPTDEVQTERVAATILREFTRRDIWVDSVEVFEWVKKPLKYKETKNGGVMIGNRTFNLGLNEIMKWAVEDQPTLPPTQPTPQQPVYQQPIVAPQQQQQQVQSPQVLHQSPPSIHQMPPAQQRKLWPHEMHHQQRTYAGSTNEAYPGQEVEPHVRLSNKVSQAGLQYAQRVEVCDPPADLRRDASLLHLTPGRKYQIIDEQLAPNGRDYMYRIVNDQGREALVGWHYFRQPQAVRQEVSFYDAYGNLQTSTQYVDQGIESTENQHRPRLLFQNDDQPSYRNVSQTGADPKLNNMLQRMDEAVRRRTSGGIR